LDKIGCRMLRDRPMQQQGSFSQAEYASKKKQTRRDKACPGGGRGFWPKWSRLCRGLGWWRGSSHFIRKASAAVHRSCWSGCCGSIFCSSGTRWPTWQWRKRCTTAKRCGVLPGLIWRWMRCRTRRRSSISGIGWSGTI